MLKNFNALPSFKLFSQFAKVIYRLNKEKKIFAMYPLRSGGVAEAVSKMAFGNRIGMCFASSFSLISFFLQENAGMIIETDCDLEKEILDSLKADGITSESFIEQLKEYSIEFLGYTIDEAAFKFITADTSELYTLPLSDIEKAWESRLSAVFPPVSKRAEEASKEELKDWAKDKHPSTASQPKVWHSSTKITKPRVIIPVFPGTNCEYDMKRAFDIAGADAHIMVFRNRTPGDLKESLAMLRKEIDSSQIIAFSGGFSAGDEPDGSGKFIANVIREGNVSDSIMNLLKNRDGLILGICNGFQALIKTGLVPFGEILEPKEDMPTLTYNTIGRHISRVVRTRVSGHTSPWASHPSILEPKMHLIPVSHGEGRLIISEDLAKHLFTNGQVFSQYVTEEGCPTMREPYNPNGSYYAIEGLTSPDGRVLGKMGHNERTIGIEKGGFSSDLLKNILPYTDRERKECSTLQNIFAAGVSYFS